MVDETSSETRPEASESVQGMDFPHCPQCRCPLVIKRRRYVCTACRVIFPIGWWFAKGTEIYRAKAR